MTTVRRKRIALCTMLAGAALGPSGPQAAAADGQRQVWQGQYDCAQGVTGLTLTLQIGPGRQVQALFDFYPVIANPGVALGCFAMSGSLDPAGHLSLTPGAWLLQPPGYVSVSLTGDLSGDSMRGTIAGPGCSDVILRRTPPQAPQAGPTACLGAIS